MSKVILLLLVFLFAANAQIDMKKDCPSQVVQGRQYWRFVPSEIQRTIVGEAVNIFSALRVFRNTTRQTLTQTLVELGDDKIQPNVACDNYSRVIGEPLRSVQECVEKCYERANLTWLRLVTAIFKCRLDTECYMGEITVILRIIVPCTQACI